MSFRSELDRDPTQPRSRTKRNSSMFPPARIIRKAGPIMGLPFLLLMGILLLPSVCLPAEKKAVLTFQEFESSCIDLGHYNAKAKELTVRFVNRNTERFYRYSNVPAEI